jgi:hypothetical protein
VSFRQLVQEIRAEIAGRQTPRALAVARENSPAHSEALAKSFWRAPAARLAKVVMNKAELSRADIKRLAARKLAQLNATATKLAQAGKLTGIEAAKIDAKLARYAERVRAL